MEEDLYYSIETMSPICEEEGQPKSSFLNEADTTKIHDNDNTETEEDVEWGHLVHSNEGQEDTKVENHLSFQSTQQTLPISNIATTFTDILSEKSKSSFTFHRTFGGAKMEKELTLVHNLYDSKLKMEEDNKLDQQSTIEEEHEHEQKK